MDKFLKKYNLAKLTHDEIENLNSFLIYSFSKTLFPQIKLQMASHIEGDINTSLRQTVSERRGEEEKLLNLSNGVNTQRKK